MKRARKPEYWAKVTGFHKDHYRDWWGVQKMHWQDQHALLATEVGQVAAAIVAAIWPPAGAVLGIAGHYITEEERDLLASELLAAKMHACAANDDCAEYESSRWWVEMTTGTTFSPSGCDLSPEASDAMYRFLADGGPAEDVQEYLRQLRAFCEPVSDFDAATNPTMRAVRELERLPIRQPE